MLVIFVVTKEVSYFRLPRHILTGSESPELITFCLLMLFTYDAARVPKKTSGASVDIFSGLKEGETILTFSLYRYTAS